MSTKQTGLEDVIAVSTGIGRVDGQRGELVVRGRRMEALAGAVTYEQVMRLLWEPEVDDAPPVDQLGAFRVEAFDRLRDAGVTRRPMPPSPMDFLRQAVDTIAPTGDHAVDATRVAATLAVAAPLWAQVRAGNELVAPDADRTQAADYLAMLDGEPPSKLRTRALETYLVTVVDHGMNASTFTARVIASTESDLVSAVAGAIGALKGPLHGGAPGPVLDMLDAIGSEDHAADWIAAELDAGRRIMGMGHRVYRVRDPRGAIFEKALEKLQRGAPSERLELARAVETEAQRLLAERHPDRALEANVEFYTAVLLEAVGIPRELFTATFAVGRALGWSAHVMEQQREGRLIRPRSAYSGAEPT